MAGFLAYIIPVETGAHPEHPIVIPPPGTPAGTPGYPAHPIYLPGYPAHPIYWPQPPGASQLPSGPGWPGWEGGAKPPGYPAHPIYWPPVPTHPIVLPPPPDQPPPTEPPTQPPNTHWEWGWSPAQGWHPVYVPGDKPQPVPPA